MPIKPDGRNCAKCGVFKLWEMFPKAACQKSGHRPRCFVCHREAGRAYAAANSERNSARGKNWSKQNRAKALLREREYKSGERYKAYLKALYQTPKFKLAATEKTMRRKALIRSRTVEKVDYAAILVAHGRVCHICGGPIADGDIDFDHVVPLAKGGAHSRENIKPSHSSCNRRKRDRHAD